MEDIDKLINAIGAAGIYIFLSIIAIVTLSILVVHYINKTCPKCKKC